MATLNFPNTLGQPTDGSFTYIENNVIYSWNGTYWSANNATDLDNRYVNVTGDTMTGDLTVPNLESAGDIQSTSQNGGPLAGFRNQLINGDFRVWQRGDTKTFTANKPDYTADRWFTGEPRGTLSKASKYGGIPVIEISETSYIQQGVELIGDGQPAPFTVGTTWTLSYYSTVAPTGGAALNVQFRDNISSGNEIDVSSNVPALTATGDTLGSGNELIRYSTTFTITATPNSTNKCLVLHLAGDGTKSGQDFAYAQLEPGPVATPFEQRPIGAELALCQRYYESHVSPDNNNLTWMGTGMAPGAGYSGYATSTTLTFNTTKRVIPTCVMFGLDLGSGFTPNELHIQDTNAGVNATINSYTTTIRGVSPVFAAAEKTQYNVLCFGYTADAEL